MTAVSAALGASAPLARLGPRVTVYPVEPVDPVRPPERAPVEESNPVDFARRDEASAARGFIESLAAEPDALPSANPSEAEETSSLAAAANPPADDDVDTPDTESDRASEADAGKPKSGFGLDDLSEEEQRVVDELRARDAEVRRHEQAHKAVAGQYAGAISYTYQQGPDGKRYAIGGQVPIDTSAIPGDPDATITKMQIVIRAALAPAEPSSADRAIAQAAQAQLAQAQAEARALRQAEFSGETEEPGETPDVSVAANDEAARPGDRGVEAELGPVGPLELAERERAIAGGENDQPDGLNDSLTDETTARVAFEAAAGYAEAVGQFRRTSSGTLLDRAA